MTTHLSIEEQIAALDGPLEAQRASHVDACAVCRGQIEELRAVVSTVAAAEVPEPSPLFWDHFSNRVRRATSGIAAGGVTPWAHWRSWIVLASATVALVAAVTLRHVLAPVPAMSDGAAVATIATGTDAPDPAVQGESDSKPWTEVVQMASGLSSDDLGGLLTGTFEPSTLVEDLNPAERAAFVRLLNAEMGKSQ